MTDKHIFNRKSLKPFRSFLRNKSTSAEAELWNLLKSKKLEGRKFRRQHSISNFIVDFCCPSEKLIIELDGNPHGDYIQIEKDTSRDNYLEKLGFTVLRFENKLVFQEPEFVLNEIIKTFKHQNIKKNQPPWPGKLTYNKQIINYSRPLLLEKEGKFITLPTFKTLIYQIVIKK